MTERTLRIMQISTFDTIGGAERVAWNLFQAYRARGYRSWLAVGHKLGQDPDILPIPKRERRGSWSHFFWKMHTRLLARVDEGQEISWFAGLAYFLAEPGRALDTYCGREDFRFPGTWRLPELSKQMPNLFHCHNLHGGYFDLRALPWLSRQAPVILTLHDTWLLSGHCAYTLGCERWKTGCGHCPDLSIPPAIHRDSTAANWHRKRQIYARSQLNVATPSRWMMDQVQQSILVPALEEARVIPNGVDRSIFRPGNKQVARAALGLPADARIVLLAANGIRQNRFKDYHTLRASAARLASQLSKQAILFIALGDSVPTEHFGQSEMRFVPYQEDSTAVARYYQAADAFAHAALVDNFPNTVLEALACGLPVVATAVGGIPEQVDDGKTGFLVLAGDAQGMATRLAQLLSDENLRQGFGQQAEETARRRFDLNQQVESYLDWYHHLVEMRARRIESAKTAGQSLDQNIH